MSHRAARPRCEALALGGSAGSVEVLAPLLGALPPDLPFPILLCVHVHPSDRGELAAHLAGCATPRVVEAHDKDPLEPGRVLLAPPDYHLLVERGRTAALSIDVRVQYCRPSIDVLFESAARAFGAGLVAVLLSGANEDGAEGLGVVAGLGGGALVQDPATAAFPRMPRAAIDAGVVAAALAPAALLDVILRLGRGAPFAEALAAVVGR